MFQLPSFFKIRMVVLIIGFFMLFWLIGFTKWCFALSNDYYTGTFVNQINRTSLNTGYGGAYSCLTVDCNGYVRSDANDIVGTGLVGISYVVAQVLVDHFVNGVKVSSYTTAEAYVVTPGAIFKYENCNEGGCAHIDPSDPSVIAACGSSDYYSGQQDPNTCKPYCKTCVEVESLQAPCPTGQVLDFQCDDGGASSPTNLLFPLDHPLGRLCVTDCESLESAWVAANCSGPGQTLRSYHCPSDTGICDTSCDVKQANWEKENCGVHSILESYDCATDTGMCRGATCAETQADWVAKNCNINGATFTFDCDTKTGKCNDPNNPPDPCEAKKDAWTLANCTYGNTLISYDCATDTGKCTNLHACEIMKNAWVTKNCSLWGQTLVSYDCATDTGVCHSDHSICNEKKAAWVLANCSMWGDQFISYNCDNDTGECTHTRVCEQKKEAWRIANCSLAGQTLISYDCATDTGYCQSTHSECITKENNWKSLYCSSPNSVFVSYDCASDTGVCQAATPLNCAEKESNWVSKHCSGEGQVLVSYNCNNDTGVCSNSGSDCPTLQSNWISSNCSSDGDIFVSFNCNTGQGICNKGNGSNPDSFTYDPTDKEKALYTDRFDKFIDDMRHTPLFSLPDQVLGNIPAGGDPVYNVQMGQYGNQDIDLSNYSSIFAICRTIFLVCFSFAALRILISHR